MIHDTERVNERLITRAIGRTMTIVVGTVELTCSVKLQESDR